MRTSLRNPGDLARQQFLKRTSAAISGLAFFGPFGRSVLGANERLHVALIGVGLSSLTIRDTFCSMRVRALAMLLVLLPSFAVMACPGCTHNRLLAEHWHEKYFLVNVIVPLAFVANRLDIARSLYTLIGYALFSLLLHSFLLWHTFPNPESMWFSRLCGEIAWWVWGLNLVGVALLYTISGFKFFRRDKDQGLAFWQPMAYGVAALIANQMIR